jgi:hypothetical protein
MVVRRVGECMPGRNSFHDDAAGRLAGAVKTGIAGISIFPTTLASHRKDHLFIIRQPVIPSFPAVVLHAQHVAPTQCFELPGSDPRSLYVHLRTVNWPSMPLLLFHKKMTLID